MFAVQSSKSGLLSPAMQEIMLHQSVYLERCAGLAKILECPEDGPVEAALHDIDCAWGDLNAAFEGTKTAYELFLLLDSANAPPAHHMWYQLGGVQLSCVVSSRCSGQLSLFASSNVLLHISCVFREC